jgi:hypothetical protein
VTERVLKDMPKSTPRRKKSSAEKLADSESKGVGTGTKTAKPKAPPKPPRFPDSISAAVKYARFELHSKNPSLKDGQRPSAASAGDHIAVRKAITEMLEHPTSEDERDIAADAITPKDLLRVSGVPTEKRLRAVAEFAPNTAEDLKALRPLGRTFAKQPNSAWRQGRYLAGIMAAWMVELRASAKAAKS